MGNISPLHVQVLQAFEHIGVVDLEKRQIWIAPIVVAALTFCLVLFDKVIAFLIPV
jgi:predicted cobalt transporter CbtA